MLLEHSHDVVVPATYFIAIDKRNELREVRTHINGLSISWKCEEADCQSADYENVYGALINIHSTMLPRIILLLIAFYLFLK